MRRSLAVVCLSMLFAACGTDTSNPMSACNAVASAACNKASSCNLLGSSTVAECTTAAEAAANCSTASCPTGTTYNSSVVNQCISDINSESCTDAGNEQVPASCNANPCS